MIEAISAHPLIAGKGMSVGGLQMSEVSLAEAAELQTPAYLFDPGVVVRRYQALRDALGTKLVVSFKANNLADLIVRCGHCFVDGIELASIGELGVVTGRIAQRRFVNNPAMAPAFMRAALISGCDFIVDSVAQARALVAQDAGNRTPRALLRLNAAAIGDGGAEDHFGMEVAQAAEAALILTDSAIRVSGVHCFGGSNTFARQGMSHAENVRRALDRLQASTVQSFDEVNLGGGFAHDWEEVPARIDAYRRHVEDLFADATVSHEAGRAIFGRAGAFLTRVVAVKTLAGRQVAICDGGMAQNFLLASTEGVLRRHSTPKLLSASQVESVDPVDVQYVGSSCNRQDVIGVVKAAETLPCVGDVCVFPDSGAYNSSYTVRDFLMLPAARNYLRAT